MKRIYSLELFPKFFTLICVLLTSLSFAQVGLLSSIDVYWDSVTDAATYSRCLVEESDKYRCGANIEVIDLSQFQQCGNVNDCLVDYAYHIPFVPVEFTQNMDRELLRLNVEYKTKLQEILQEEIDRRGDCIPIICADPSPQPQCIAQAIAAATVRIYSELQPWYWQEVYKSVAAKLPTALHWQSPALPNQGAIVQPFFTSLAKPLQLAQLASDPRQQLYYHQPNTLDVDIPYISNELNYDSGGIESYELDKASLEPATLFEYQQFGFTSMYEIIGNFQLELTWGIAFGFCATLFPPSIQPRFAPVPLLSNNWLASSNIETIAEGYPIPHIEGEPILYPF